MTYVHAVIVIDSHKAQITPFTADAFETRHIKADVHETRQHKSDVRDVHEFLASVCDDITGLDAVLVTGGHTGLAEFKHYVAKHRPALAETIIGYETVDHPSEGQLVAYARDFFANFQRLAH